MGYAPRLIEVSQGCWVKSDVIERVVVKCYGDSCYVETKIRDMPNEYPVKWFHSLIDMPTPRERAEAYAARIVQDCNK